MLPKKNRLDRKSIEKVFKDGKFINAPNLSLKYFTARTTLAETRIAFIAPKTVSKKAVERNLLRRRGYSLIEKRLTSLPGGFHGAFIFGKKSLALFGGRRKKRKESAENLAKELELILKKL